MRHCHAFLLLVSCLCTAMSARAASQPNILFILTEDQGPHMSFLETPGVETPNMDSIARSGVYVLEGEVGAQGHDLIFAEIAHQVQRIDNGMQERSVYDGEYHLIYREGLHKPRTVNADLRDWKPWRNRSYAETVKEKDNFPLGFELLSQVDPQSLGGKPPKFELYNTKSDPDEIKNLAHDPAYRVQLDRLRRALAQWIGDTDDAAVPADKLLAD